MRDLTHEREKIAFGIAKEGHPEVAFGHAGDDVRYVLKFRTGGFEALEGGLDVGDLKIQNRAGMIEFGFFGIVEHKADATAIEEAQLTGAEEMRQSENITIECGGAIDVMGVDGDLSDTGESGFSRDIHGGATPIEKIC